MASIVICLNCGIEFTKRYHNVKKFCKDECRDQFYQKRKLERDSFISIGFADDDISSRVFTRNCKFCDDQFTTANYGRRYCGISCERKAKSGEVIRVPEYENPGMKIDEVRKLLAKHFKNAESPYQFQKWR